MVSEEEVNFSVDDGMKKFVCVLCRTVFDVRIEWPKHFAIIQTEARSLYALGFGVIHEPI